MTNADSLYHRLFSHPLMVEHLVRDSVDDVMAAGVDFDRMERVSAKFHATTGPRREGDVIWRLPTGAGTDIYLYLMIEFQSKSDWWMAVRTQVYQGLLWQQIIAEKTLQSGDRLPPVLLVVLYNGSPRWSAPTETRDLVALPPHSRLWHWQPQCRYHLLDVGTFDAADLRRRKTLAALLFRLEQAQPPAALADLIDDVIGWFREHPGHAALKQLFTDVLAQAIDNTGATPRPDTLEDMQTMVPSLAQQWKQGWFEEGKAEGEAEGLQKGQARALLRLLEQRFGPLSNIVRDRVAKADAETIELWLDRVLDAPTIDAVFDGTVQ